MTYAAIMAIVMMISDTRISLAIVIPLIILAAAIEVFVTPRIAVALLGGP